MRRKYFLRENIDAAAKVAAEKGEFRAPAPKGASDFKEFMSSLKR
jgi:hypothetical protein